MSEHVIPGSRLERPRKRKLRYPRTSNACSFCRKRKVRCTGTQPCEVCVREEVPCEYSNGGQSFSISPASGNNLAQPTLSTSPTIEEPPPSTKQRLGETNDNSRATSNEFSNSRSSSIDPPQTFMHGQHVGPTSGVSFLYGQWNKVQNQGTATGKQSDVEPAISNAPLIEYGDIPHADCGTSLGSLDQPLFKLVEILEVLERYFQFVSPTYRYLHQPTTKNWAIAYVNQDPSLTSAQAAAVLLACAQTLLHSSLSAGGSQGGPGDLKLSTTCSEVARKLLDSERGPPSLASVQARIAMCMYFLSTYHLNECRYCFSFAWSVATALGIHRRQPSSSKTNGVVDAECRKRTFWSAYVLDGYLSVMLGRPRLIRDDDVDQPFPENIADHDLMSSESLSNLPRHGNLEAFVAHAQLAKLMGKGSDLLYPLYSLTKDQILDRSNEMVDALAEWEKNLPGFLKPQQRTMTAQRGFERQNTILKLGVAHVRILATRRCLLIDLGRQLGTSRTVTQDPRAMRSIRECISAIIMILDATEALIENGQCYCSFWSTQYIALVAISTLYVMFIQGLRRVLPGEVESFLDVEACWAKARRCHDHLETLPPPGSQAERHLVLLAHLRSKAEKSLARQQNPNLSQCRGMPIQHSPGEVNFDTSRIDHGHSIDQAILSPTHRLSNQTTDALLYTEPVGGMQDAMNDMSMFSAMLTPNSNSDNSFQYMLDFGWESLDTIGPNIRGQDFYSFGGG